MIHERVGVYYLIFERGVEAELVVDPLEVLAQFGELFEVVVGAARIVFEHRHHAGGVGLAGSVGERRNRSVEAVDAGVDCHAVGRSAHSGGLVRVQNHGNFYIGLQSPDDFRRDIRGNQPRHILDHDCGAAHFFELAAHADKALDGVHGAAGVADGSVRLLAEALDRVDGALHVAGVVERVENAHHIQSVGYGFLVEFLQHIVGVGLVDELR